MKLLKISGKAIAFVMLMQFVTGCYSSTYKVMLVVPKGFTGKVYIDQDAKIPVSYDKEYRVVIQDGRCTFPAILSKGDGSYFTITKVVDDEGNVLSSGLNPKPGEIGMVSFGSEIINGGKAQKFLQIGRVSAKN